MWIVDEILSSLKNCRCNYFNYHVHDFVVHIFVLVHLPTVETRHFGNFRVYIVGSTWPKAHSVSLFVDCTLLMLPEFFRHCHFFYRSMVLPPTIIVIEGAVFWKIMKTTSYFLEWPSSSEVGCALIERHFILFRAVGREASL